MIKPLPGFIAPIRHAPPASPRAALLPRVILLLTLLLAAVLSACSLTKTEPVSGADGNTKITRYTGFAFAETPADPSTANLPLSEYEASLRRITVRYNKFTAAIKTDPMPLLSERQVSDYAAVLAAEIPKLTAKQRLNFVFTDRYNGRGYTVDMDVYREGIFLVYRFKALSTDLSQNLLFGEFPTFLAHLEAQPGQQVLNRDQLAWVKDPLIADVREAASIVQAKQALLDEARKDNLVMRDEVKRLEAVISRPLPSVDAWKAYWERRRTLQKAYDQNLMDKPAFQAQVDKLNAEIERQ